MGQFKAEHNGASSLQSLNGTTLVINTAGACYQIPTTFTLKSADATRKIEFSTDGGVEYFEPAYDVSSTTMLVTTAFSGISHVKFTGASTDKWSIA